MSKLKVAIAIIFIAAVLLAIGYVTSLEADPVIEPVNGDVIEPEMIRRTFWTTEMIYEVTGHRMFFHGFKDNKAVFGHAYSGFDEGWAMSNFYVILPARFSPDEGRFVFAKIQFRIVKTDYANNTITLEWTE